MRIILGDYLEFEDKLYIVQRDRQGNPLLSRVYRSSYEMLYEDKKRLENTITEVKVGIKIG